MLQRQQQQQQLQHQLHWHAGAGVVTTLLKCFVKFATPQPLQEQCGICPLQGGRPKEREGGREHCLLQANLLPYLLFNHNGKFEARRNKLLKFAKIITPCNAFCNRKSRKSNGRQTTLHYKHYNRSWPMPPTSGRRCCCCCCCCTVAAAAETAAGCNSNRTS